MPRKVGSTLGAITMMNIVTDRELIRMILRDQDRYATYVGAGVSVEANVTGADGICNEIRRMLKESTGAADDAVLNAQLRWDDPKRRYSTCLQKYGNAAQRVEFFRRLLRGKRPCFAHHAVALLSASRVLKTTCLTTNFDKLLEIAFAEQGSVESQAIRMEEEAQFWGTEPDKCYVLKLHGDYDTHNILNTRDETLEIPDQLGEIAESLLQDAGLVVLGAAGYEDSVQRFFDRMTSPKASRKQLSMGLFWGVYVGGMRPDSASDADVGALVTKSIDKGGVSQEVVEMMSRASRPDRMCAFFPVWGSGAFFFSLIQATRNKSLIGTAERFLDHEMRLRHVFGSAGLTLPAIDAHLEALQKQRERILEGAGRDVPPERIWSATRESPRTEIRVIYGDITSRSLMGSDEFVGVRRAVVSPEDTCISAGGGVAYGLLRKAGAHVLLNELGKLSPISHGDVAVTSGGNLPVHYIIHAAALSIREDASYAVTPDDVLTTVRSVLRASAALRLEMFLIPLLAAGLGPLTPRESLEAICRAVAAHDNGTETFTVQIVIFHERQVPRLEVGDVMRGLLGEAFVTRQSESGS